MKHALPRLMAIGRTVHEACGLTWRAGNGLRGSGVFSGTLCVKLRMLVVALLSVTFSLIGERYDEPWKRLAIFPARKTVELLWDPL